MSQQNLNKTIKTVRALGVISLLLSGFVFLWQGFYDWNGFERYLAFLGLNALLSSFGIFCAQVWREPKGARTMLALAGAGVSVQVAQVAGMIFETWKKWHYHTHALSGDELTRFMHEKVPSVFGALDVNLTQMGISLGILLLSAPLISQFCFKVLDRKRGHEFSILLMFNSLFLLFPIRDTYWLMTHIICLGLLILQFERTKRFEFKKFLTFEFWISLAISSLPLMIHLVRDFFYVSSSHLLISATFMILTLLNIIFNRYKDSTKSLQVKPDQVIFDQSTKPLEFQITFASMAWIFLPWEFLNLLNFSFTTNVFILLTPLGFLFGELFKRKQISAKCYQTLSAILLGGFTLFTLAQFNTESGLLLLFISGMHLAYSMTYPDKRTFQMSTLFTCIALSIIAVNAITFNFLSSWLNLAIIGIATVLGASLLERRAVQIKEIHADFMKRF